MAKKNDKTQAKSDSAPAPDTGTQAPAAQAPKKRGRTHLTQADKDHMQLCRKVASEAKSRLALVLAGDEITKPENWNGVPSDQFDFIAGIVTGVKALRKSASIQAVREQYESACKASGQSPDPELMSQVPDVAEPKRPKYNEAQKVALATARKATDNAVTQALCDERITDHRVWADVPGDKLDAIAGVIAGQAAGMASKRVNESAALLASLLKG
jgi:hypothetical protein